MRSKITFVLLFIFFELNAQSKWQQNIRYTMDVDVQADKYQYSGSQNITYTNNSPDTLNVVFFHLYLNAFQPNSEMDFLLQNIEDPDRRMVTKQTKDGKSVIQSRIAKLTPDQIGFIKVTKLLQDGQEINFSVNGTVLKAQLKSPILPQQSVEFSTSFEGQLPEMIRRSGRNNPDGVALSMTQWYPKLAAYDERGWNTSQYLGREFYGAWGDYDVRIHINSNYILGGTGYLVNANEVGYGYQNADVPLKKHQSPKITWHFKAENVHDFAWAADPEFKHDKTEIQGVTLHFLYKKYDENWKKLSQDMEKVLTFYNQLIGKYPWSQYSFIQGGDGGMEYAMCTLIAGKSNYASLRSTASHELGHAWFQQAIGTDETSYAWMDEGFTSFIEELSEHVLFNSQTPIFQDAYKGYLSLAQSGKEEPATTHSDRYKTNFAYSNMAYNKGMLFLVQLSYIIGSNNLISTLKQYYKTYLFKSPTPVDFIRVAEKVSGMQLQWYLNEFIQTTHVVDYAIDSVKEENGNTSIVLKRKGEIPMPVDVFIRTKDNKVYYIAIPSAMTFGEKPNPYPNLPSSSLEPWGATQPTYTILISVPIENISSVKIDPEEISTDINREDNEFHLP